MSLDMKTVRNGIVCLTFDDGRFREWLPNLPLFRKYGAHATFFYSGELSPEAVSSMKILLSEGHSVGLHTLHHKDATDIDRIGEETYFSEEIAPQIKVMEEAGLKAAYFACPNNARNDRVEAMLAKYFRHCRAGIRPSPPKGYVIADQDQAYMPLEKIASSLVFGGNGIGDYYLSSNENLDGALERAARENTFLTFFSHGISPDATGVHIRTAMLEHLLAKGSSLGVRLLSMGELP